MNTTSMIDKVDETHQGNGLLSTMSGNSTPVDPFAEFAMLSRACLGLGLCGCSQGVHCLRASTQSHCPPSSKSERLQGLMDLIDEALSLVSDLEAEEKTQCSVESSEETKAHSNSEQDEHPSGVDANAPRGSSSTS